MEKDFKDWHKAKKEIHTTFDRHFYHEREVRWCSLGQNIGYEIDGKGIKFARPVLILKGFNKEICLCLPITTKYKQGKYYHELDLKDGLKRHVILSQIRLIDTKRLGKIIGVLDEEQFHKIKKAFISIIQ
jgi:mRNA interferase MazF